MTNCDMCGTKIENSECSCGIWESVEETQGDAMKLAIDAFHEMKKFTLTGDAPRLGCAFVFFRGDYHDCKRVEKFVRQMKGRRYYEETEALKNQ